MQDYNDEIQLKGILVRISEYKSLILKKKLTILMFSSLFFVIGVLIAFISETEYNAELTFVVESDQSMGSLAGMSGFASQLGFDMPGNNSNTFSQSNIIELLKSRLVIEGTLMQHAKVNNKSDLLIEHYLQINNIKEDWDYSGDFAGISFHDPTSYLHDSIRGGIWKEIINEQMNVDYQSNEANIITLSYVSLNQEFAKEFVENLILEMSAMYTSHQTAKANNTLTFLQNRADSVFKELQVAEQEFAKIKDINQRIVKASGRLKELQLMRKVEVLNTMYLEIIKNLELSKITLLNEIPIINIIDKPILPLEQDRLSLILTAFLGAMLGGFLSVSYFIFWKLFKDAAIDSSLENMN